MKSVLVIEDDKDISDLLEIHLVDLGYKVIKAHDGKVGLTTATANKFDFIVLDIMLPGMDGFEICKEIRKQDEYTPILILTSKSEEFDKVLGLEFGADDYLTKPFAIREFIARVKAIMRRVEAVKKSADDVKDIKFGELLIEPTLRKVTLAGNRVDLTPKEFDLIYLLASHPGRTYTREQLLNTVWGYQFNGYEHTVNSHINRLRSKIEKDISNPKYILTTWGVGYRFVDEEELSK